MSNQVNGILSPYLREKRIDAVKNYLTGNVLDFGCGVGKLCDYIENENYTGVDIDQDSINEAKKNYPNYNFFTLDEFEKKDTYEKFDTIVSMAVIEHVKNPEEFLINLSKYLKEDGCIVLTTPHPKADWMHDFGSKIGLFSSHANEEHEELLDEEKIKNIAKSVNMKISTYTRFLFGVNQLIILQSA